MASWEYTRDVFVILFSVAVASDVCRLEEVQKCIGSSADLAGRIYANPTSSELLKDIRANQCDKSINRCIELQHGNCSENAMAPYQTIVDTVTLVCRIGVIENPCLARGDIQHACDFCFRVFKVVIDSVVGDLSVNQEDMEKGLCNAYTDVRSCCMDAAYTTCNSDAQAYISTLLDVSTSAYRTALNCEN